MSAIKWEPYVPEPSCGAKRGPRSQVRCELPPDHERTLDNFRDHFGRSPSGRWFSWKAEDE